MAGPPWATFGSAAQRKAWLLGDAGRPRVEPREHGVGREPTRQDRPLHFGYYRPVPPAQSLRVHEFLTVFSGFVINFFLKISKSLTGWVRGLRFGTERSNWITQTRRICWRACHCSVLTLFPHACNGRILSISMQPPCRKWTPSSMGRRFHVLITMRRKFFHGQFLRRLRTSPSLTGVISPNV